MHKSEANPNEQKLLKQMVSQLTKIWFDKKLNLQDVEGILKNQFGKKLKQNQFSKQELKDFLLTQNMVLDSEEQISVFFKISLGDFQRFATKIINFYKKKLDDLQVSSQIDQSKSQIQPQQQQTQSQNQQKQVQQSQQIAQNMQSQNNQNSQKPSTQQQNSQSQLNQQVQQNQQGLQNKQSIINQQNSQSQQNLQSSQNQQSQQNLLNSQQQRQSSSNQQNKQSDQNKDSAQQNTLNPNLKNSQTQQPQNQNEKNIQSQNKSPIKERIDTSKLKIIQPQGESLVQMKKAQEEREKKAQLLNYENQDDYDLNEYKEKKQSGAQNEEQLKKQQQQQEMIRQIAEKQNQQQQKLILNSQNSQQVNQAVSNSSNQPKNFQNQQPQDQFIQGIHRQLLKVETERNNFLKICGEFLKLDDPNTYFNTYDEGEFKQKEFKDCLIQKKNQSNEMAEIQTSTVYFGKGQNLKKEELDKQLQFIIEKLEEEKKLDIEQVKTVENLKKKMKEQGSESLNKIFLDLNKKQNLNKPQTLNFFQKVDPSVKEIIGQRIFDKISEQFQKNTLDFITLMNFFEIPIQPPQPLIQQPVQQQQLQQQVVSNQTNQAPNQDKYMLKQVKGPVEIQNQYIFIDQKVQDETTKIFYQKMFDKKNDYQQIKQPYESKKPLDWNKENMIQILKDLKEDKNPKIEKDYELFYQIFTNEIKKENKTTSLNSGEFFKLIDNQIFKMEQKLNQIEIKKFDVFLEENKNKKWLDNIDKLDPKVKKIELSHFKDIFNQKQEKVNFDQVRVFEYFKNQDQKFQVLERENFKKECIKRYKKKELQLEINLNYLNLGIKNIFDEKGKETVYKEYLETPENKDITREKVKQMILQEFGEKFDYEAEIILQQIFKDQKKIGLDNLDIQVFNLEVCSISQAIENEQKIWLQNEKEAKILIQKLSENVNENQLQNLVLKYNKKNEQKIPVSDFGLLIKEIEKDFEDKEYNLLKIYYNRDKSNLVDLKQFQKDLEAENLENIKKQFQRKIDDKNQDNENIQKDLKTRENKISHLHSILLDKDKEIDNLKVLEKQVIELEKEIKNLQQNQKVVQDEKFFIEKKLKQQEAGIEQMVSHNSTLFLQMIAQKKKREY